jgi:flagellar biosynthesis protein FlhF
MREALLQIKQDLGEDAVILKTRNLPKKFLSLGSPDEIEVTAAIDEKTPQMTSFQPLRFAAPSPGTYERPKPAARPTRLPDEPPLRMDLPLRERSGEPEEKLRYVELKEDLREVKELVKSVLKTGSSAEAGGFAGGWAVLYKRLVDAEVKPAIAANLIESVRSKYVVADEKIDKTFIAAIGEFFPVSGPLTIKKERPLVVAFVGPTGSGKTTTLAKLAAHYVLSKKKSAAIITADTYRIAAIEQIRTFADIAGIALEVVFTPEEADEAIGQLRNEDVVFVDTAGRSQRNKEHMAELKILLSAFRPTETHLVVSATTKDSDLDDIVKRYADFGINRLLFTKLDETARLGNVLNCVNTSRIPVSYFTNGQSVPDDIELAQPGRFVQRLWEGTLL